MDYIGDTYAPDNTPRHRMETERFAGILQDMIAKHGRHRGPVEFIRSIQDVPRPLLAGIVGMLLVDRYDHERRDGETTLLSVHPDLWDVVVGMLEDRGFRVEPAPGTRRRYHDPIHTTYTERSVVPAQADGSTAG